MEKEFEGVKQPGAAEAKAYETTLNKAVDAKASASAVGHDPLVVGIPLL